MNSLSFSLCVYERGGGGSSKKVWLEKSTTPYEDGATSLAKGHVRGTGN